MCRGANKEWRRCERCNGGKGIFVEVKVTLQTASSLWNYNDGIIDVDYDNLCIIFVCLLDLLFHGLQLSSCRQA